jgi:hypothetical protein
LLNNCAGHYHGKFGIFGLNKPFPNPNTDREIKYKGRLLLYVAIESPRIVNPMIVNPVTWKVFSDILWINFFIKWLDKIKK